MTPPLLALDLGNSSLKGGVFEGDQLVRTFRLPHPPPPDALAEALGGGWEGARCGIASVVPPHTDAVASAVESLTGSPPLRVHAGLRLPFRMAYETPDTLGADRIAAAAGAATRYPHADPLVVVDAGTAVTLEVVSGGAYLGGAIAPGPDLLRRALARGTAQLPEVEPAVPDSLIGRSTREALQAGVMGLFLGGVRGLLGGVAEELGAPPFVVATGGWGGVLAERLCEVHASEPDLVLHGIRALVGLND